MGFTHYWRFNKPKRGQTRLQAKAYRDAVLSCSKLIRAYYLANGGLSGYSAHTEAGQYAGVNVNGAREAGHETFVLREHLSDYFTNGASSFDFCKTARKPYDAVVVACLCILANALGETISVSSDGDSVDWITGLEIARRFTKNKRLPLPRGVKVRLTSWCS